MIMLHRIYIFRITRIAINCFCIFDIIICTHPDPYTSRGYSPHSDTAGSLQHWTHPLSGKLLIMLLHLIIHRRLRYIITHRRIRTQPAGILRIKISRSVVIQPHARNAGYRACFILLFRSELVRPMVVRIAENYFPRRLRGMSVRQVTHALFVCRLFLWDIS